MTIDKKALDWKTCALLEYPQIMESVASYALSEEAASLVRESAPSYEPENAEKTKRLVSALFTRIKSADDEPRSWLPSVGFLLPKIGTQGAVLDLDEALAIGLFIERGEELRKWAIKDDEGKAAFAAMLDSDSCPDCKPAAVEVFRIVDREGKLRDLPSLRAIRRRISGLERELKTAVSRYTSDDEYRRMLQSALPSQRDGRTVLAVKANFRGRIRGIVHEASSSGQTVFVEPLDVVEKNNEILIETRNLNAEIQRILRELTEKIAAYAEPLEMFHSRLIELECLRARARYSAATKGSFVRSSFARSSFAKDSVEHEEPETLILKLARHPLLAKAVPVTIEMKNSTRTLIITGPNTGGKTVALKTLGLFALMNQSGLALPLEEGSVLPVFDGVYADIGDEQSIKQSLSTFSAHVSNISSITAFATEKSLVLLDELGAGTDPEEGGAIAMAVLDFLIERNSRLFITTHHGILKNYGYTRRGVENASVEFNARTLSPTYRIINGVPGESRALDIALANGLDRAIVEKARLYIDDEKSDVSALISGLEQKHRELAGKEMQSALEQGRLREQKRKADLKELQLRQKEAELKRDAVGKLQNLLRESRKTLENLVREVKEGELGREKTLKVKEFLDALARNVEDESAKADEEERAMKGDCAPAAAAPAAFAVAMEVLAGPSKQRGVILQADKKSFNGNSWIINTGSMRMSLPEKDLVPAAPSKAAQPADWSADLDAANNAVFELKLLGMRLDEATDALRRQIDAASLSGLKAFAVVHGKGEGVLQKGIHAYLKNDPSVADYYFARPELGGFGRTEVILR
jgi:DNA mismatch repair protein MutS2